MSGPAGLHVRNDELNALATVLERAAAVTRNEGEDFGHIESWKYACGRNYKIVTDAIRRADTRIAEAVARGVTPDWPAAARAMEFFASKCGVKMAGGDDGEGGRADFDNALASVLAYGPEAAVREGWFDESMQGALEVFARGMAEDFHMNALRVRDAAAARIRGFEEADAIYHESVVLPVYVIPFEKIPERVSGGFIRELIWMMKDVPEGFGGELADVALTTGNGEPGTGNDGEAGDGED